MLLYSKILKKILNLLNTLYNTYADYNKYINLKF